MVTLLARVNSTYLDHKKEYERAVILRNGIVQGKAAGPGLFYIIPGVDEMNKVDLRERAVDIQPQEILTKDSVSLRVDAVVYYEIFDPTIMVLGVQDARVATIQTVATNLRSCFCELFTSLSYF